METPVILVLCTYPQDQIPNPFRKASGHDSFLFRDGCASTLRKLAAKPGNVQPGSASTHRLILQIGSRRLLCDYECLFTQMNSGLRFPCGKPSGALLKRSCKVRCLPPRMLGRSIASQQLRICLRSWHGRGWSKSGAPPLRLQRHSPSLPGMRSICSRGNCDRAFASAKIRTVGWFLWMLRARGNGAGVL